MPAQAPVYSETRPTRLWVRLAPPSVEKLDRYAEHRGITRAGLLHKIIGDWLEGQPEKPGGPAVRSERIYDRSEYMKRRMEAREREVAAAAAIRAIEEAQDSLQKQWSGIIHAMEEVKQVIKPKDEN